MKTFTLITRLQNYKITKLFPVILLFFIAFYVPTAKADFPDVAEANVNFEAINYVQAEGIVSGYPDGTYKPFNMINRAEFTKIIIESQFSDEDINDCLYNNTDIDQDTAFFPDVPITAWFAKYVCVAKVNGVVSGYPDGTFGPGNDINFAEAAKIIVNSFNYPVGTDSVWFKPFVDALAIKKAIPPTISAFNNSITRGEMAEMIWRLKADITDYPSLTYADIAGTTEITSEPSTIIPSSGGGTTYYVRPDGGSAEQCNGKTDAAFAGSTNQNCAWDHPFRALPPYDPVRIAGGDTLIIAKGDYKMGYGDKSAIGCEKDFPWDCNMAAVPSGPSADKPTRILGAGWDSGCTNPPQLWGTQRAYQIFNLTNTKNAEIECLEITDHSGCVESHSGSIACERDNYPYGDWAATGIYAQDSENVTLKDLNVHGFAHTGIQAGRLKDWNVENVRVVGNGWVGWDGDIDGDDSNSGTLYFKNWVVEWNGCGETYPGKQPTGCWAQTAGGYGDGVGTGSTGGNWVIEDSFFRFNTSDGLDLLYMNEAGSSISITRSIAEGNAGNQFKVKGPTTITNSIAISNCGFFEGKSFTYNVDNCRAGGSALALNFVHGDTITLTNNTIYSEGDCLMTAETAEKPSKVISKNNIFYGATDYLQPFEHSCLIWSDVSALDEPSSSNRITFDDDYSIIFGMKEDAPLCPVGSHDKCEDPQLVKVQKDSFDFHLKTGSPAIDAASVPTATDVDFGNQVRGSKPDMGAYEVK